MRVNSLPKTVTGQRRGWFLNPGPSAPESSRLTTRLPSVPCIDLRKLLRKATCNKSFTRGACDWIWELLQQHVQESSGSVEAG